MLLRALSSTARRTLCTRHEPATPNVALSIIENKLQKAVQTTDWKQALGTFQHFATTHPNWVEKKHATLVLRVCASQGRHREAKKVLHIMQSLGVDVPEENDQKNKMSTFEAKALICQALAENGKGNEALEKAYTLANTSEQDTVSQNKLTALLYLPLLKAFTNKNEWEHTLTALKHMQEMNLEIPLRGYRLLMLALSSGRQSKLLVNVALQVVNSSRYKLDVSTYTMLIKTLSASGEHEAVQQVLDKIQLSESPDWMTTAADLNFYNAVIRAKMLANNMDEARQILNSLHDHPNVTPNAFSYTTCMLGYLKNKQPNQVTSLYEDMNRRGIAPSVLTLSCVLRAIKNIPQKKFLLPKILELTKVVPLGKPDFVHSLIDALDDLKLNEVAQYTFQRAYDQKFLGEWRKGLYSLNLHTFSKGSAKIGVQFSLNAIANQPTSYRNTLLVKELKIITGKGKGSKEYLKPVLKPEIIQLLKTHFSLRSYSPAQNPGCLLVPEDEIQKWIDTYNAKEIESS